MHSYGIGESIIIVFKVCAQLYNQGVWLNLNSQGYGIGKLMRLSGVRYFSYRVDLKLLSCDFRCGRVERILQVLNLECSNLLFSFLHIAALTLIGSMYLKS